MVLGYAEKKGLEMARKKYHPPNTVAIG